MTPLVLGGKQIIDVIAVSSKGDMFIPFFQNILKERDE
jgi:hypothetical protein